MTVSNSVKKLGAPVGNHRRRNGEKVTFIGGNGCRHYGDCLSCIFKDCYVEYEKLPPDALAGSEGGVE